MAVQSHDSFSNSNGPFQQARIRALAGALTEYCPSIPSGGKVELLDDPFDKEYYESVFVTRLRLHTQDIEVHRWPPASSDWPSKRYDCTLAYRNGRYVKVN